MSIVDVSFIVPAQLSDLTLDRTLRSIINQKTKLSFEIIVIVQTNDAYYWPLKNIRVIKAPLRGASFARNLGIKNAQGSTLAFVDGDTILEEDWLETLHDALISGNWAAAQGKIVTTGLKPGSHFFQFRELSSKVHYDGLKLAEYPLPVINTAACLYRKNAVEFFAENLSGAEDVELSWRVLHHDERGFVYVERAVASCIFLPENYFAFLKRNFKVGKNLKLISSVYGDEFQKFFALRMFRDLKWQCSFLSDGVTIAIIMRLLATATTLLGFHLEHGKAIKVVDIKHSSIYVTGKKLAPEERIILSKDLRKLNLKSFDSSFINNFEIILDDNRRKMIIRKT